MSEFLLPAFAFLGLMVVVAAWVFRSSNAPLTAKMVIPIALMVLAYYAPKSVNAMLGSPQVVTCGSLPASFEIIAFTSDREDVADIFVRAGGTRLYQISLDPELKKTLASIQPKLAHGPVRVGRHCDLSRSSGGAANGGHGGHVGESVLQEDALPLTKGRGE